MKQVLDGNAIYTFNQEGCLEDAPNGWPAVVFLDQDFIMHYQDGLTHSTSGPAVTGKDAPEGPEYYFRGRRLSKQQWQDQILEVEYKKMMLGNVQLD